ncbi:MAG: FliG C-terminal domain-containing protein [Candidatus Xenobia bacterium]
MTARQKTAVLLSVLPQDTMKQMLNELGSEASSILLELGKVGQLSEEVKAQVIEEFLQQSEGGPAANPTAAAASAFGFTLPSPPRTTVGGAPGGRIRPFESLRGASPKDIFRIIRREHPQTISVILSCLAAQQASAILAEMSPQQQSEVARRLAEIGKINSEVLAEIEKILEARFHALVEGDFQESDGKEALLNILNQADRGTEDKIISGLTVKNPQLAGDLKAKLCDFEDLISVDDGSLQQVVRLTDMRDLCIALKGANKELAERMYRCMAPEAARALRGDVERLESPSFEEIKAAKQQIRNILRGLVALGKVRFK